MYALVPAPVPPAVDSKLNPHVDTQGTSRMSIFACIYHRSAFSFFKTKRKAPFSPAHKSFLCLAPDMLGTRIWNTHTRRSMIQRRAKHHLKNV